MILAGKDKRSRPSRQEVARRLLLASLAAIFAAALATTAHGQLGAAADPGETTGTDTGYTPRAKEPPANMWQLVSGPPFKGKKPAELSASDMKADSPADFESDLYDVAFRDTEAGLSGGDYRHEGKRFPVIYSYTTRDGWKRDLLDLDKPGYVAAIAWLGEGRAIAVGGDGRYPRREADEGQGHCAGDTPISQAAENGGHARVWTYESGKGWSELRDEPDGSAGDQIPDAMAGLTAADVYESDPERPIEFGVVGGLCQLWHWVDGGFWETDDGSWQEPFSSKSTPATKFHVPDLVNRVRQVSFAEPVTGLEAKYRRARVYAVTGGCCADAALATAAVFSYTTPGDETPNNWIHASTAATAGTWQLLTSQSTARAAHPDSFVSVTAKWQRVRSGNFNWVLAPTGPGTIASNTAPDPTGETREPPSRVGSAKVLRSLSSADVPRDTGLTSASLRDGDGDIGGGDGGQWRAKVYVVDAFSPSLETGGITSVPLYDDDPDRLGVIGKPPGGETVNLEPGRHGRVGGESATGHPDGVPDWSVGVMRRTGQGIAFGTDPAQLPPPREAVEGTPSAGTCEFPNESRNGYKWSTSEAYNDYYVPCNSGGANSFVGSLTSEWDATNATSRDRALGASPSHKLLNMPGYGLNSIDVIDPDLTGWAVGDRGTIVRMKVEGGSLSRGEPDPPKLGEADEGELPDSGVLSVGAEAGELDGSGAIPAQGALGRERIAEPAVELAGRAEEEQTRPGRGEKIRDIVISGDGEEGVAFGDDVWHFDGTLWRRCLDPEPEQPLSQRPGCAGLTDVLPAGESVIEAERVPLERDDNPSNDAEFEVFATTGKRLLRFAGGTWTLEAEIAGLIDLAFATGDDGLALTQEWHAKLAEDAAGGHRWHQLMYRYDGNSWRSCQRLTAASGHTNETMVVERDECDPRNRLPQGEGAGGSSAAISAPSRGEIKHLMSAGTRIWAVGERSTGSSGVREIGQFTSNADTIKSPVLAYRESGDTWAAPSSDRREEVDSKTGPLDPDIAQMDPGAVTIAQRPDGRYEGWARVVSKGTSLAQTDPDRDLGTYTPILRLDPHHGWQPFRDEGALADHRAANPTYFNDQGVFGWEQWSSSSAIVLPGSGRWSEAVVSHASGRVFRFNPQRLRWDLLPRAVSLLAAQDAGAGIGRFWRPAGGLEAIAPDGQGGFWAVSAGRFVRYTDRPFRPVFEEVAQPSASGPPVRVVAGAADGTVWAGTDSDVLYRYTRPLGWDRVRIPGWEFGRVVTAPSKQRAIAVGRDGRGVVVGDDGRIANIAPASVRLDPAAGRPCPPEAAVPPCGASRDLLGVALSPQGDAVAVGESRVVLWRPAGGEFRRIAAPDVTADTDLVEVAAPAAGQALVRDERGRVFSGRAGPGGAWTWRGEMWQGESEPVEINEFFVDAAGVAFAYADNKLLEWDTKTGRFEAADPAAKRAPALVGRSFGEILTRTASGHLAQARPPEYPAADSDGALDNRIASTAIVPGPRPGQLEAWAVMPGSRRSLGGDRLFHFASDRDDPRLDPATRGRPLPDSPAPREGELSFAAFGKSDCQNDDFQYCRELSGITEYTEQVTHRIVEELLERRRRRGDPAIALSTGDSVDVAGHYGSQLSDSAVGPSANVVRPHVAAGFSAYGPRKLRRWGEMVPDRLSDRAIPTFGAIGAQDQTEPGACDDTGCTSTRNAIRAGDNLAWRQAMRRRDEPWGERAAAGRRKSRDSLASVRLPDPVIENQRDRLGDADVPAGCGQTPLPIGTGSVPAGTEPCPLQPKRYALNTRTVPLGGGSTHYALDLLSSEGSKRVARIIIVDNSNRSLAASDPLQQPLEADGQLTWLESMLCFKGQPSPLRPCTRREGQPAIVVANTPTYSYGAGAGTDTATDAAAFEGVLMKGRANVVVSGRIGWNGRYWAVAPGLHYPCIGEGYPADPPAEGTAGCDSVSVAPDPSGQVPAARGLSEAIAGATPPPPPGTEVLTDTIGGLGELLPFVVASGAGGRFAGGQDAALGKAAEGMWHGYTVVRLDPSGDPRKMVVEQRPVYDWIGLEGRARVLRAGQRMKLTGFGRGPVGFSTRYSNEGVNTTLKPVSRTDRIDTPGITHRYDLLAADPDKPWLPAKDSSGEYVELDPAIATIDSITGQVRAGRGNHPRTVAIALFSVDRRAATYPLVFEPRRSFKPATSAPAPRTPSVIVQSAQAGITPPASPSSPPTVGSVAPPALPSFPTVSAPPATPPLGQPQPAPPPPPPPPPPIPAPLQMAPAPPGLTVAPPSSVIPPPAPPINPAPPGGARKEARQRQAATEKSGSESGASETSDAGGDLAQDASGTTSHPATARERARAESASFTTVARPDAPSAWARGALYGGGLTVAALALAGFWTARPRPGRRSPAVPAPARARYRGRF